MLTRNNRSGEIGWQGKTSVCTLAFSATVCLAIGFSLPFWSRIIRIDDSKLSVGQRIYVGLWGSHLCNTTKLIDELSMDTNCIYVTGVWLQHKWWFIVTQILACLGLLTSMVSTIVIFYGMLKNQRQWQKITVALLLITGFENLLALLMFRNIYAVKDAHTTVHISISVLFLALGIGISTLSVAFCAWLQHT